MKCIKTVRQVDRRDTNCVDPAEKDEERANKFNNGGGEVDKEKASDAVRGQRRGRRKKRRGQSERYDNMYRVLYR